MIARLTQTSTRAPAQFTQTATAMAWLHSSLSFWLLLQHCASFTPAPFQRLSARLLTRREAATGIPIDGLAPAGTTEKDEDAPNVGVLLLNLGGPETGDDVEGTKRIDDCSFV